MEYIGGLIGVSQRQDTYTLRPEIGWAVREVGKSMVVDRGDLLAETGPFSLL